MIRAIIILALCIALIAGGGIAGIFIYRGVSATARTEHRLSVEKIESLGKMELVKMNINDVVEQTSERPFCLPNAKAVLIIADEAYAGIDFQKGTAQDVADAGSKITVTLPKPEILLSKVNHE